MTVKYDSGPSQKARSTAQESGKAFKNGRYVVRTVSELEDAITAFGRVKSGDKAALKRFIMRRASALGRTDLIPDNWKRTDLARRGPYQRHVKHTKQFGKKKGNLSAKADWQHPYKPKSDVAVALKAKHLSKDDLTSKGNPKPGKRDQLDKPVPPHLKKAGTKAAPEKSKKEETTEKTSSTEQSQATLRKTRTRLEAKRRAGTLTAKERQQLNSVVTKLKKSS